MLAACRAPISTKNGPLRGLRPPRRTGAVEAAIEREKRVVIAHFGIERRDFRRGDIGRVEDDELERAVDAVAP